jgi:hypothetical protein
MSDFKRGDKITVKGSSYGSHWFVEKLPKGYEGRKCAMVKIVHSSSDEKSFDDVKCGILRSVRLVDVRPVK